MRRKYGAGSTPVEAIHCQLPLFCAGSPSSSRRSNQSSPSRQSRCRSFVRNEPTIEPRAVVHPARRRQLAHRRRRRAGSRCGPSCHAVQQLRVVVPVQAAVSAPGTRARVLRVHEQHVRRRSRARPAGASTPPRPSPPCARARCLDSRADRQPQRRYGERPTVPLREVVVTVRVVVDPAGAASARARRARPARRATQNGSRSSSVQPRTLGMPPRAGAVGQRERSGASSTARRSTPCHALQKGVKTVYGLAAARSAAARRRCSSCRRAGSACDARVAQRLGHAAVAAQRVGRDVARPVHGPRADLERNATGRPRSGLPAHDEPGAALAQLGVELAQAAEQEGCTRPAREAAAEQRARRARTAAGRRSSSPAAAPEPGWSWTRRSRRSQTIDGRRHTPAETYTREAWPTRSSTSFPLFPLGIVALPHRGRAAAHLRGALPRR